MAKATTKSFPIQVSTGGISKRVYATSRDEAFRIFVERYKPKRMGRLTQMTSKHFVPHDGDRIFYIHTASMCARIGLLVEDVSKRRGEVKAVNCHDQLVEALRKSTEELKLFISQYAPDDIRREHVEINLLRRNKALLAQCLKEDGHE